MTRIPRPFGTWPSPIDAATTTRAGVRFIDAIRTDGEDVTWVESRPAERGRSAIVRRTGSGVVDDVGPDDFDARTRVHEYGGGAYAIRDGVVYASRFDDQRLYRIDTEGTAEPLAGSEGGSTRFADLTLGGTWAIGVMETHRPDDEPVNELVRIDLNGTVPPVVVASGHDFYACPRLSPDGRHLAWITWDHPDMPWDATTLWLAAVSPDGEVTGARSIAGGAESLLQPAWSPDGVLHVATDRTGWWNLHRWTGADLAMVTAAEAEYAVPHWVFGSARYAFLDDGRIVALPITPRRHRLEVITDGQQREVATPFTTFQDRLAVQGTQVIVAGSGPDRATVIAAIDVDTGAVEVLRAPDGPAIDPGYHSMPEAITFATPDGPAHAFFYPPTHPVHTGVPGESPPVIVSIHGGPSSATSARLDPEILFWTSRGFGILDVDHGGSTSAGRSYRRRLDGRWGEVDVRDCALAALHAATTGRADPHRLLIHGGSAGGFTTLLALTRDRTFAAGTSYFGVTDLEALAADTHKFESRYLDRLVGPYPEQRERYRERSPVHLVDRIAAPVLLLQGLDDLVVPPSQSRMMRDALLARGVRVGYLEFPGEGHGFRAAATRIRALEAELAFYGEVLGFTPADPLPPVPGLEDRTTA